MFNRLQVIIVSSFIFLLFFVYFACDRVPKNHQKEEVINSEIATEAAEISKLIVAEKKKIASEKSSLLLGLEQEITLATSDTAKSNRLKKLSGLWYREKQKAIAGYFAEKVAEIEKTAEAWNIAGSTLFEGISESEAADVKQYCTEHAAKSFENAIAIAPKNVEYQISQALCFTENPPQDNPMKGILMLRELDTKFPENAQVLFQLAKLAMRTNQYEKAITRLEQILRKDPKNPSAICLIADAYASAGNASQAKVFGEKCKLMLNK